MSKKSVAVAHPALSVKSIRTALALFTALVLLAATQTLVCSQSSIGEIANDHSLDSHASVNLIGIKCVVHGVKNAQLKHSVKFKEGTVFFSTKQSALYFRLMTDAKRANPAPIVEQHIQLLIAKANHQLTLTEQYTQTRCPVTGKKIDDRVQVRLGGIDIKFHDSKAADVIRDQPSLIRRAPMVFSERAYKAAFQPVADSPTFVARKTSDKKSKK